MTITLNPHTEARLRAIAAQRNLSVEEVIELMVEGEIDEDRNTPAGRAPTLYELAAPIRGLLTDEEIDTLFERDRSPSRQIDLG